LYCRGWFDTLGWRYYANASNTPVDTTTQIYNIEASAGQFITATDLDAASGLVTNPIQTGDNLALSTVQDLLNMGTTNQRRMLASVDINRRLAISEQPASPYNPYLLRKDGRLNDPMDNPVRKELCMVGIWAQLKDIISASIDLSKILDPSLVFIDEAEYEPAADKLTLTPYGNESPWSIGRPIDG
jgi:hypothetical protein